MKYNLQDKTIEGTPEEIKRFLGREPTPTPTPTKRRYRKKRQCKRWTTTEKETLYNLYHAGKSNHQIAKALRRSVLAVATKIHDLRTETPGAMELSIPRGRRKRR